MSRHYDSLSEKWGWLEKNMGVRVTQNWVRATFGKVLSISEPQFPHFEMEMVV